MIPGDHLHANSSRLAVPDGLFNFGSGRINHAGKTKQLPMLAMNGRHIQLQKGVDVWSQAKANTLKPPSAIC